jgi:hypothetical protein
MVAIAFSILFGFIALSAMTAIRNSVATGLRRGRDIQIELEQRWDAECAPVTRRLELPRLQPEGVLRSAGL